MEIKSNSFLKLKKLKTLAKFDAEKKDWIKLEVAGH